MRQLYSRMMNRPIVSEQEGKSCGQCNECIIDFEKGIVAACTVSSGSLLNAEHLVLLLVDIRGIDETIRVNSEDALSPAEEVVRLKNILSVPHSLIMVPAATESKRTLGHVLDFAFDDISGLITELHIGEKHILSGQQIRFIVPRSAIVKFAADGIVVKDSFIEALPEQTEEFAKQPGFNPEPA